MCRSPHKTSMLSMRGTPMAMSHANQFVATESVLGARLRLSLVRVSNSQELAKIDPDTGLQQRVGPSLVQALTVSAQRHFSFGSLQATFDRAQAKNRLTGQDVPEAPPVSRAQADAGVIAMKRLARAEG